MLEKAKAKATEDEMTIEACCSLVMKNRIPN